jgi:hypothetical protein
MTSKRKVVVPAVTGVVAVVVVVLGISLRWAPWITVVAAVACCAFGVLVYLAFARDVKPVEQNVFIPPPAPEPQPSVQMVALQGVNLPSAVPDYEFMFDATVYWRSVGNPTATMHVRPGARGIDAIIQRAAAVAATEQPGMAIRLQHRLNDVLGVVEHDQSGRIEAWADNVRTNLFDADAQRLRALADIRKDKAVWEHQRRFECDRRGYLTDDVLRSTGSALVWWLSRNETEVTGAVDLIGTMARLSAAARDEDVPDLFRHLLDPSLLPPSEQEQNPFALVGGDGAGQPLTLDFSQFTGTRSPVDLVTALMGALGLDDEQRALFAARVAAGVASTGKVDTAEQIRQRFDVITDEPTDEPATAAPQGGPEPTAHTWPKDDGTPQTESATTDLLDD